MYYFTCCTFFLVEIEFFVLWELLFLRLVFCNSSKQFVEVRSFFMPLPRYHWMTRFSVEKFVFGNCVAYVRNQFNWGSCGHIILNISLELKILSFPVVNDENELGVR